jgi:hypothetical protein
MIYKKKHKIFARFEKKSITLGSFVNVNIVII